MERGVRGIWVRGKTGEGKREGVGRRRLGGRSRGVFVEVGLWDGKKEGRR